VGGLTRLMLVTTRADRFALTGSIVYSYYRTTSSFIKTYIAETGLKWLLEYMYTSFAFTVPM
jgi:hypothetical protein